jgi:hypothetical protein
MTDDRPNRKKRTDLHAEILQEDIKEHPQKTQSFMNPTEDLLDTKRHNEAKLKTNSLSVISYKKRFLRSNDL